MFLNESKSELVVYSERWWGDGRNYATLLHHNKFIIIQGWWIQKRERESNKEGAEKRSINKQLTKFLFKRDILYRKLGYSFRRKKKKKKFLQHLDFFRNSTVFSLPPSLFQSGNYVLHRLHVQNWRDIKQHRECKMLQSRWQDSFFAWCCKILYISSFGTHKHTR